MLKLQNLKFHSNFSQNVAPKITHNSKFHQFLNLKVVHQPLQIEWSCQHRFNHNYKYLQLNMRGPDLTTEKRNKVVQFLLEGCNGIKPARGKMREAQIQFAISRQTVWRLWTAAKKQKENGEAIHLVSKNKNRKSKKRVFLDLTVLKSLPYTKRCNIESLSQGLGVSRTTVWRWVQSGQIRAHTSALKPDLTAPNKLLRIRFSLEALEFDRIMNVIKFKNMHNIVHIDEKWFYITRGSQRFYLAPDEAEPYRSCKSKKFICKVMFMCAVCRPLFGPNGEVYFDGKLGIFPFTTQVPAKRNSKNRPTGTLETKPIESITKAVIKDCLITKVSRQPTDEESVMCKQLE